MSRTPPSPGVHEFRSLLVGALTLEASFILLHLARTPAEQTGLALLSYTLGGAAFAWVLWCLWGIGNIASSRRALALVIVAAVVFRLTLLPLAPATSPDVHRYLWEGIVQSHGFNPYVVAPDATELASVAGDLPKLSQAVTYPHIPAIYPPFAQFLFLCNAMLFGGSLLGWKLILLVFDGVLAVGVWTLLKNRSLPTVALAGVLWCPLLLLETYEAAHLDVVGAALIVLAVAAMDRRRPILCGVALGLCINVKYLWPLLVLILLVRQAARQRHALVFVATVATVAAVCWLPYRSGLGAALETARMFTETWTFNDLIFEFLRDYLPGPRWAPMVVVTACLVALATALALRRSRDVWVDVWLLSGAALLLSPVAYPWYFLWIVPGLAIRPPAWLVIWVLSVPALHMVDWHYATTGQWNSMPWLWVVVGVAPALLLALAWWQRLAHSYRSEVCGETTMPAADTAARSSVHNPIGKTDATIAVIIPALNEEQAISNVLAAIPAWVDDIVVADNGSTDRTAEVAKNHGARVVHEPRRGYGSACLWAMEALDGPDVVVFLDGDYSDNPEEMALLVDPILSDEVDLVVGSRVLGQCASGALTPPQRFGNWLSCKLLRLFWGVKYTDLGPFRAIRYRSLQQLGMCDPDYGWTVEMQVKAAIQGLRAREVPVSYRSRIGKSKVSGTLRGVLGAGTKILYTIFAAAWRSRRLRRTPELDRRLIVFTRYPEPGKVKTRLIPTLGDVGAARLHRDMTIHTLAWARELNRHDDTAVEVRFEGGSQASMQQEFGADVRYVPQGPGDLGARMACAVDEAVAAGAGSIVIVGTDCPQMTVEIGRRAFDGLQSRDLVLGPAFDGGYYLIGLRRPLPELFRDIPWGSAEVLNATLRRANEQGVSYLLLEELRDVDRPGDLPVWEQVSGQSLQVSAKT